MGNCNTTEYWNKVWSKRRYDDNATYLHQQAMRSIKKGYWDDSFKNPIKKEKYSVQRAWWYATESGAKSVLDVGCGNGRLLYGMKFLLESPYLLGIDFSKTAIERMKEWYGINGEVLDVFDIDKIARKFDMVVVNDVLEHIEDEALFLNKCKDRLNDGGTFYLALPNNMLGPDETDEHLRVYTEQSTRELLDKVFDSYELELIDIHILCIAKKVKTT